jgi:uncharacterized protein (TIGR02594 family)
MNKQLMNYILEHYYGVSEVAGSQSNDKILKIIQWAMPWVKDDSKAAWCAIFLSYVINETQILGTQLWEPIKLARRFDQVGIEVDKPMMGDIVIFWRGKKNGWKGHVGIFIRQEGDLIYTLGGNQNNQINIRGYSANRVLEYRRLIEPINPF